MGLREWQLTSGSIKSSRGPVEIVVAGGPLLYGWERIIAIDRVEYDKAIDVLNKISILCMEDHNDFTEQVNTLVRSFLKDVKK